MKTSRTFVKTLSAAILVWNMMPPASAAPQLDAQVTSRIEGRIIDGTTGMPVADVRLRLSADIVTNVTASDGTFMLTPVSPGPQRLYADKAGFVGLKLTTQSVSPVNGVPVNVEQARPLHVELLLYAAPVVTGRVLDANGKPVADASVIPFRFSYSDSGERVRTDAPRPITTNELGEFRITSLDAGTYGFRISGPVLNFGVDPPQIYIPLYFPGTTDPAKAELVQVSRGGATSLSNLTLPSAHGGRLRIHLIDQSGENSTGVTPVWIRHINETEYARSGRLDAGVLDSDVGELTPGKYTVEAAFSKTLGAANALGSFEIGASNIVIDLLAPKLARMVGHVVTEATADAAPQPVPGVTIQLLASPPAVRDRSNKSDTAGTITLNNVYPGTYHLGPVTGIPAGMFLTGIREAYQDVAKPEIRLTSGEELQLTAILGAPAASIQGTVTNANGEALRDAVVALLPDDRGQVQRFGATTSDTNGTFQIQSAPGDYHLYAWTTLDGAAYRNAEFMKIYDAQGQAVQLDKGSHVTMPLKTLAP